MEANPKTLKIYQDGQQISVEQAVEVMHSVGGIDKLDLLAIAKRALAGEDEALEELEQLTELEFI